MRTNGNTPAAAGPPDRRMLVARDAMGRSTEAEAAELRTDPERWAAELIAVQQRLMAHRAERRRMVRRGRAHGQLPYRFAMAMHARWSPGANELLRAVEARIAEAEALGHEGQDARRDGLPGRLEAIVGRLDHLERWLGALADEVHESQAVGA